MVAGIGILVVGGVVGTGWMLGQRGQSDAIASETDVDREEDLERVPVELDIATVADLPNYFHATGTIEARRQVDLTARTAGYVSRLAVEEGDWVKAGQLLAQIDPREQTLLVEEARVRAATSELELDRIRNMSERGLETDRALEEAQQAFEVNQAQYELAKVRLADHSIRAPWSGQVTTRHIEMGQSVQAGAVLLGLADTRPLEVRLHLPERVVARLAVGQPVSILPDVSEDEALTGTVTRIAPVVDPATSTVKVTLEIAEEADVRVGSFVRAKITTDTRRGVISVPKKALVAEAGATFVFVAESDSVRRLAVSTGYSDEARIEVIDGLSAGDHVVVVGQGGLRHGSRIEDLAEPAESVDSAEETHSNTELARTP